MTWVNVVGAIVLNALASVMLKLASQPPHRLPSLSEPWLAITNWPLLTGLAAYCLAFVLYTVAVSRLPIGVVYPVLTSGAIALVVIMATFVFKEPLSARALCGILLVVCGIVLITRQ